MREPLVTVGGHPPGVVSSFHLGARVSGLDGTLGRRRRGVTVVVCTRLRTASLVRMLASLARQERRPDVVLIVDASPDTSVEVALLALDWLESTAASVRYYRVAGDLVGLTRQRNFSLRRIPTDLVAFFDDDVVLDPDCLSRLERAMRSRDDLVGAGAAIEGESVPRIWKLRRRLRIISTLEPGRYCRSGMSIPWGPFPPDDGVREGDWLPGCGMMWRTEVAASLRFRDEFPGYAQGEDLEFSLRARRFGKLGLVPAARLRHLHEPAGRPDDFRLGYAAIANRFEIHRGLAGRTRRDVLRFAYAWTLDTLLLARHLADPSSRRTIVRQAAGRLAAARDLLAGSLRPGGPAPASR